MILKSYDGGKRWEAGPRYDDFGAAAGAAQSLRVEHPSIRFRVEADAGERSVGRGKRSPA